MPCGSTICASTNDIQTALSSFPDRGRFWQIPLSWLGGIAMWHERRRQYTQLLELDDRLLADIGISRPDADEMALKSSCIGALMWHAYR
jgi:uncharacterized protein YjiS (DUF1127 family)